MALFSSFKARSFFSRFRAKKDSAADTSRDGNSGVAGTGKTSFFSKIFLQSNTRGTMNRSNELLRLFFEEEDALAFDEAEPDTPAIESIHSGGKPSTAATTPTTPFFGEGEAGSSELADDATCIAKTVLEDCSKNNPRKEWVLSHSSMYAYTAMRGPGVDEGDPLISHILAVERAKKWADPTSPSIMESITNEILSEDGNSGHSHKGLFEIDRPETDHIHPPSDYDPDPVSYHNSGRDQGWFKPDAANGESHLGSADDYVSDEEGDPVSGRISPCTFLRWATGAKRWDEGHVNKPEVPEDQPRMRPATPDRKTPELQESRAVLWEPQYCAEDGMSLSGAYSVPDSESIIFDPPGACPIQSQLAYEDPHRMFDRMAPLAARELRELRYGKIDVAKPGPVAGDETYSSSEIANALSTPGTLYGGVTGIEFPLALFKAREVMHELSYVEAVAEKTIAKLRERADELEERRNSIAACLPTVAARRERAHLPAYLPIVEPQQERDQSVACQPTTAEPQKEREHLAAYRSVVKPQQERDQSVDSQVTTVEPQQERDLSAACEPTVEPQHDGDQPTACLPAVDVGREGNQRAGRIRAFAAESLRDMRVDVEAKTKTVDEMRKVFERGTAVVAELEADIEKLCMSVGLHDYQEVFSEFDQEMMEMLS